MPFTSFPAELHSIKLRFVFGAGALAKIWTCFHFFESISILFSRSHTFPFLTFLYLLLLPTLSSFFPTEFCLANFPILEKKGILSGKGSRSGCGEIGSGFFPKCLAGLVRLSHWGICQRSILPQFVTQKLSHLNQKLSQFRNALPVSFLIVLK